MRATPPSHVSKLGIATVAVPLALAVLLALHTGSLAIPHNDDWSYLKSARHLAATGHLQMQGWVAASLVGQLALFAPLLALPGAGIATANTAMAVVAGVGLLAARDLYRRVLSPARAVFATLVTALFPGFLLLSTSFMTDVPAFTLMLLCLAAALRGFEQGSGRWLVVSVLTGLGAVTVRQQCIAAVGAVLIVAILTPHGRPMRRTGLAAGAAFAMAAVLFFRWRRTLPHADSPSLGALHLTLLPRPIFLAACFLGLALLPVTVASVPRFWDLRFKALPWLVLATSWLTLTRCQRRFGSVFQGNYLDINGPYTAAGYGSSLLFPPQAWKTIEIAAMLSTSLLLALAAGGLTRRRLRALPQSFAGVSPTSLVLAIFTILYAGALLAPAASGWPIFDRYLLPLTVPVIILALRSKTRLGNLGKIGAAVGLLPLAAVAVVITWAASADDAARWHASEQLVSAGANPRDISSGLEWQGTYAAGPANTLLLNPPASKTPPAIFTSMFAGSRDCWVVTRSRVDSPLLELVRVRQYTRLPGLIYGHVWTYRGKTC